MVTAFEFIKKTLFGYFFKILCVTLKIKTKHTIYLDRGDRKMFNGAFRVSVENWPLFFLPLIRF